MVINNHLFKDLFIESHKPLAIQSLKTLNNLDNFIIVNYGNNIGYEIIPIREFNFLDSNNVVITILDDCDATFFATYSCSSFFNSESKSSFIIINNKIALCRSFDVKDKVCYLKDGIAEDKDYLELLVNQYLF